MDAPAPGHGWPGWPGSQVPPLPRVLTAVTLTGVGLAHELVLCRLLFGTAAPGFLLLFDFGLVPLPGVVCSGSTHEARRWRAGGVVTRPPSPEGTHWWVHLGVGVAGGQERPWWGTADPWPRGPRDILSHMGSGTLCGKDESVRVSMWV